MIVDFTVAGEGLARLTKLTPRVDPGTEERRMWDIDLVAVLDNEGAAVLQSGIPHAQDYLSRATSKIASAVIKVKPVAKEIGLTLQSNKGVMVLDKVAGEIRSLQLNLTDRAQGYTARIRIHALDRKQSADLLMVQGKTVAVTVDPRQQPLPLERGARVGDVVSARLADGNDVYGLYRGERDGGHLVDDFGVLYPAEEIISSLVIEDEGGVLAAQYGEEASDNGTPTWRNIVVALSKAFARGAPGIRKANNTWVLTEQVVDDAIALGLPDGGVDDDKEKPLAEMSREELREVCRGEGIKGFSKMSLDRLPAAIPAAREDRESGASNG